MTGRILDFEHLGEPAERELWEELLEWARSARSIAALTGAGISVESGVPDFRSPGGIWSRYPVEEYGTIQAFLDDPEKAWVLYRAIWGDVEGKEPNPAHRGLQHLEEAGLLAGIVTQNIDNLHQAAGSRQVIEIHGECRNLQCIDCGWLGPAPVAELMAGTEVPRCPACDRPVKPNVVFFGENVRGLDRIAALVEKSDLMLVIGTSAGVYPANLLPIQVAEQGGRVVEFNREESLLTRGGVGGFPGLPGPSSDLLVKGRAAATVDAFARALLP